MEEKSPVGTVGKPEDRLLFSEPCLDDVFDDVLDDVLDVCGEALEKNSDNSLSGKSTKKRFSVYVLMASQ